MPIFGDPIYWFCTGGRTILGSTYGTNDHCNNEPCDTSDEAINASVNPSVVNLPLANPPPINPSPINPPFALRRLDLGMALFSVGISFIHPVHGDRITVQIVPEPHTFQNIRDQLTQTID